MKQVRVRTLLGSALAAAMGLSLFTGCSMFPFLSQSPSQLATGAANSWYKASALQFKGSMTVAEGRLDFAVTESEQSQQGKGSGTLNGQAFTYLAASSNEYLKGQAFWQQYYTGHQSAQLKAKGIEDKYAQAQGNDVVEALQGLTQLGGDITQLQADAHSFKKGSQRTIDGQQATALTFGGDTFWVAQGNPDQLVGFRAATAGSLHNVNVTIAPTRVPNVSAPGQSVNPNDPSTLPAQYEVLDTIDPNGFDDCDQNTCVLHADVTNNGGSPQGPGTLQLTAQDPNTNGNVASCSATIPNIPSDQDADVTCTVSGGAWTAWGTNAAKANDGYASFNIKAQITANPPYVGS